MAFILRIGPGRGEGPAVSDASSPESALLRLCGAGRTPYGFSAPGVGLVVDPLPHDCRIIERRRPGGRDLVAVCFGWCGLLDREGAQFDDQVLDAVLAALRADPLHPAQAALRLTGNFAMVIVDGETSRVFVLSDEWASRCFYYGASGQDVVVSSRAAAVASLLGAPIDGMSWIAGVRGAFPSVHASMFQGVRKAMPGQALVADLARGSVTRAGNDRFFDRHVPRTFAESVQTFAGTLRGVARRCASLSPGVVDLSGGNDSRMLAAALHAEGLAGAAVFQVRDDPDTADGLLAREIASRLGARILCRYSAEEREVPIDFFSECSRLFDGNFMSLSQSRRMWYDRSKLGDFRYRLGGVGAEFARDYFWRHEYLRPWPSRTVDLDYLLRRRLNWPWRNRALAAAGIRLAESEHDEYLLAPLRKISRKMEGSSRFYALDILCLVGYMIGRVSTQWAFAPAQTTLLPGYGKEFLDAVLSACWWHRINRRLSLEVTARLAPGLVDVPNNDGTTMMPLSWSTLAPHLKSLAVDFTRRQIVARRKAKRHLAAPRAVPEEYLARGRELDRAGGLPEEASRLFRWLLEAGTNAERLDLLPAVVGLGEVLQAYPGIRRELSFADNPCPFLVDEEWRPARGRPGNR